jgi:hypothetical protein
MAAARCAPSQLSFCSHLSPPLFVESLKISVYLCLKCCRSSWNMSTLLFLLLALYCRTTIGAPFKNITGTQFISTWVSVQSGRTTKDILYNSVGTLVLCVWNSVHLNIPAVREDKWVTYRRKTKWIIAALLAPELLVFTAFQQWLEVRKFLRELKSIHAERPSEVRIHTITWKNY